YASLFDRRFSLDRPSGFTKDTPSDGEVVALASPQSTLSAANRTTLDAARTARSAANLRTRSAAPRDAGQGNQAAADTTTNRPTIFQNIVSKLFGKPTPVKLAYATADDSGLSAGSSIAAGRYDRWTAVYDISARTVYMPDGTRLEAHSGLGDRLDDP